VPRAARQGKAHHRSSAVRCSRYNVRMSRYRLEATPQQESILLRHRRGEARRRAPPQPQPRRREDSQGGLGTVPLVAPGAGRREIVPGDPRPLRPLARRVRRDPRPGARAGDRRGRGGRPGHQGQRRPVHRGAAALPRPDRAGGAAAALVRRLQDKAPGRVQQVPPAFTSQRCSACGHTAPQSRESQAAFRCVACGFACNADVNAAKNIAAGHAVKARGGDRVAGPVNREPQLALLA
jgi:hypothetical protein